MIDANQCRWFDRCMKITSYSIVSEPEEDKLIESVQRAIQEGWQPIGGVSHSYVPSGHGAVGDEEWYNQAIVQYAPQPL